MVYAAEQSSSPSQHQTTDGSSTKSLKSERRLRLNHNEMLQIWHLYTQTDTKVDDIAKMFNMTPPSVYDYLDRSGLPYERRGKSSSPLKEKQVRRIKTLRASGHTASQIAALVGCSGSTVYRHLNGSVPAARNRRSDKPIAAVQQPPAIELPVQMIEPNLSLIQRIRRWFGG
jgi:DNA-binding CsgD family transcriptional regulator